jgi:hypothetical protein
VVTYDICITREVEDIDQGFSTSVHCFLPSSFYPILPNGTKKILAYMRITEYLVRASGWLRSDTSSRGRYNYRGSAEADCRWFVNGPDNAPGGKRIVLLSRTRS